MPKLTINGTEVTVDAGTTVLQACEQIGIEIPRFCYHDRLQIAGNCRMCLVEMEKSPKPIASCAMPVAEGMVILTNTPKVRKARQGVMEFLLINHPLDCPICDQGGECDLQDQTMAYGLDRSRYAEFKRAVPDKELGPLITTHMTRCIHCTRCIRFATEIAGVEELGALGRGEHMEIGTYVEKAITSELSGNMIDLCPVGALNSKPYAYTSRSWELTHTETIDVHDAVGSNVRVDARGREVMRVLPRLHEDINEEWISDKTRFSYDGLRRARLDQPFVRKGSKLQPATWAEALRVVADRMAGAGGAGIAAIAGDLADIESMWALKELFASLGSANIDCRQDGAKLDARTRAGYLFNTSIAGIEAADACLLIGTNPRWEAALVNARLRKRFLRGGFNVYSIGSRLDLTFPVETLGAGTETISAIVHGTHPAVARLKAAKRPMVIVGQGALVRPDGAAVLAAARRIAEQWDAIQPEWNGFNVLHTAAARVGGLDIGFVPQGGGDVNAILDGARAGKIGVVYLLGADEIDMSRLGNAFVVYQGHHGDAGAHRADVVLPGAAYTEKPATYVNLEGRPQRTKRAVFPPGEAREDWTIIRALSEVVGAKLPYDSLERLREHMIAAHPHLGRIDLLQREPWGPFGAEGALDPTPFRVAVEDFYMTNAICRASETMAACSELFVGPAQGATGTHG